VRGAVDRDVLAVDEVAAEGDVHSLKRTILVGPMALNQILFLGQHLGLEPVQGRGQRRARSQILCKLINRNVGSAASRSALLRFS